MTDAEAAMWDDLDHYARVISRCRLRFGQHFTVMQLKLIDAKAYLSERRIPPWNRWKRS